MSKILKGHFLSDLHLFARRSTAMSIAPMIHHAARQSHTMALESKPFPRQYAHWLYDLVVHARLHRTAMHAAIRPKSVFRKLTQYLTDEGFDSKHGVRDVYFGHTHRAVHGVQYAGLTFHNGGASIHGLPFRIIETRLPFQQSDSTCNPPTR